MLLRLQKEQGEEIHAHAASQESHTKQHFPDPARVQLP